MFKQMKNMEKHWGQSIAVKLLRVEMHTRTQ